MFLLKAVNRSVNLTRNAKSTLKYYFKINLIKKNKNSSLDRREIETFKRILEIYFAFRTIKLHVARQDHILYDD